MSDRPVLVRKGRMADYDAMVALFEELDEFHRRGRPDVFRRFGGPARTREQVAGWLAGPGSTVLVGEDGGEVGGLALLLARPRSPFAGAVPRKVIELDNLVVRADRRGGSIGHRLLRAVTRWARAEGATHIEVGVHAFNGDARRFYEGFGFVSSIDRLVMAA